MAQWGKADFAQLKRLQERLSRMDGELDKICMAIAKDLAARLLALTKKGTPVRTGHLRRQWTVESVHKEENGYVATIYNGANYASYVEYGHRTANHSGWVKGSFMLTNAQQRLLQQAPGLAEKKLKKYLQEALDGQ